MDISNWIERWADFTPAKAAITFEDRTISYSALRDHVRRLAVLLRDGLGVSRGERVAFLGLNSPEFLALTFACARIGAIMVPLNWRLAATELAFILDNAGCVALFVEPELADTAAVATAAVPGCRTIGKAEFAALLARSRGDAREPAVGLQDPILIVYTSGTTGRPKGAVLSQSALAFNAANAIAAHDMTSRDRVLTNLPMFHVGGLNIQTTPALCAGASIVVQRRFEPDATIAALEDEHPSLMILVPALMRALADHPAWPNLDFSGLRCINTGSTAVPMPLLEAYLERGVPVTQVYGTTETAPIAIHQRIAAAWTTAGSTGKPALYCEAAIVGPNGDRLPAGARGEIVVSGPNLMTRYWRDEAATAEALRDGWFHTGDVGLTDEDGNYYVVDRLTDVIISGSENIYPAELERILERAPGIAEAAVVARPDERWGEVPVACVVTRPHADVSRQDVLGLFAGELARYKHPRDVVFVDALPRNVMGKVLKFELRRMLAP